MDRMGLPGLACIVWLLSGAQSPASGQDAVAGFSALSDIGVANVARLVPVAVIPFPDRAGFLGVPAPAGDLLLVQTPFPHTLHALDLARPDAPARWQFTPQANAMAAGQDCCGTALGAPAVADGRVFMTTFDGHAFALDAATGRVVWDRTVARVDEGESLAAAPLLAGGRLFVGVGGDRFGARGAVVALDAATGAELWRRFSTGPDADVGIGEGYAAPEPGGAGPGWAAPGGAGPDRGVTTWPPEGWLRGGGGVAGLAFDPALDLLFHGTGHPAPGNPHQRPGDNRWTSGLFARDPANGAARWFDPINPHDLYLLGAGPANLVVDMAWQGAPRRLLVHADGNGHVYVMDRETGALLSAERFVPTNATAGVDLDTGTLRRVGAKAPVQNAVTRDVCPATPGATGPGAPAFLPGPALLVIPANLMCMDIEVRNVSVIRGTPAMGSAMRLKGAGPDGGAVIGWDLVRARPAWTAPERFPVLGGVLGTAGGLVFHGTLDGLFRARDAATGAVLWQFQAASGIVAAPVSYRGPDGRQYVAVLAGLGGPLGRVPWASIDVRDATAGWGAGNGMRDLAPPAQPGGVLYVFAMP